VIVVGVGGAIVATLAFTWLGVEPLIRRWRRKRRRK
jgi:hypothetical protein